MGMTNFFDPDMPDFDKSYGELYFSRFGFGVDENGQNFFINERLESHRCTREELGLESGPKTKFMPLSETSRRYAELHGHKLQCLDDEDLKL